MNDLLLNLVNQSAAFTTPTTRQACQWLEKSRTHYPNLYFLERESYISTYHGEDNSNLTLNEKLNAHAPTRKAASLNCPAHDVRLKTRSQDHLWYSQVSVVPETYCCQRIQINCQQVPWQRCGQKSDGMNTGLASYWRVGSSKFGQAQGHLAGI